MNIPNKFMHGGGYDVRQKMAEREVPLQQEDDDVLNYYDIMVIGRTGMGKSTTVDKLLIANSTGRQYSEASQEDPIPDFERGTLKHGDMTMWHVSDDESDKRSVAKRLKNLIFFKALENSHKEINQSRTGNDMYGRTLNCELLSNESTRVRVLDVPGFFGVDAADGSHHDLGERAVSAANADLGIMRKILRIKTAYHLNFSRIVYFLPDKGSLKRASHNLKMEIATMEKYFGRSIFDSMVVVATFSTAVYEAVPEGTVFRFTENLLSETQHHFQEAMHSVFNFDDTPRPPIVFISLNDTCEDILYTIQKAEVREERLQLSFSRSLCTRCGIKTKFEGKDQDEIGACSFEDQPEVIPLDESTCHPLMIPKYSKLKRFFGGVAHVITFYRFEGKWPSFLSADEVCIKCRLKPGTRGCLKVGSEYQMIVVSHTNTMEACVVDIEGEQAPPPEN